MIVSDTSRASAKPLRFFSLAHKYSQYEKASSLETIIGTSCQFTLHYDITEREETQTI